MVERTLVAPPGGRVGPLTPEERRAVIQASPLKGKYDEAIDPESAFEMLAKRAQGATEPAQGEGGLLSTLGGLFGTTRKRGETLSPGQAVTREVTRSVAGEVLGGLAAEFGKAIGGRHGASIGRALVRGALGGLLRR
jgi:hypothetical protein